MVPFAVMSVIFCEHTQWRFSNRFCSVLLSTQIILKNRVTVVVVDVGLMSLQLWRLSRFGPSAAFDSDRLVVQQKRDSQLEACRNPDG